MVLVSQATGLLAEARVVRGASGAEVGSLIPINSQLADDVDLLSSLTNWRRLYEKCFFTQFEPTVERTRRWLQHVVLRDPARVLLLVCELSGRPIGTVGLCHISEASISVDNVLRGERSAHPRLMFWALATLLSLGFDKLATEAFRLEVFSDNRPAIRLYRALGFTDGRRIPLRRIHVGAEVHFVDTEESSCEDVEYEALEMLASKPTFQACLSRKPGAS